MNTKKIIGAALFAVIAGGVFASETEGSGFAWAPGDGVSFNETSIISTEASLNFDSRYVFYGVVDGKDPIVRPSATATFGDWVYLSAEAIFDLTKGSGKRGGYGNRAGKYSALYPSIGLAHEFDLGEQIGTLGVDFGYQYWYTPRSIGEVWDTQYLYLELTLEGHWIEPTLYVERDIMADEGTYVNLALAHTFETYIEGLSVTPSIAQGFGNSLRTKGYFAELEKVEGFDHGGLMDTTIKLELEYEINDWLKLGAYIAYYDYLFDDDMREAAAAYNAEWGAREDKTWNFVGGLSLTAAF